MPNTYMQVFRSRREQTTSLQNAAYCDYLMNKGFCWVRPLARPWHSTLREPTIGRFVELTTCKCRGTVHMNSRAAERLIWQLCGL